MTFLIWEVKKEEGNQDNILKLKEIEEIQILELKCNTIIGHLQMKGLVDDNLKRIKTIC